MSKNSMQSNIEALRGWVKQLKGDKKSAVSKKVKQKVDK